MAIKLANNQSLSAITALPTSVSGGTLNLISTTTASSSGTVDITSGIDSTYKEYQVHFFNVHPSNNATMFAFQGDTGTNTSYNQTITSTHFSCGVNESGGDAILSYQSTMDQSQGTAFQKISNNQGNENDECLGGILTLYDPSSTTFVKNFMWSISEYHNENYSFGSFTAGYFNTTSAITRLRFKFESGDVDVGTFKLYGVS